MADIRVVKTKRNLKQTLAKMLEEVPFEKVTVAELCRRAETSRITFYTHYEDKYDLTEELFGDYAEEAAQDYRRLQAENDPKRAALLGYYNMIDCILNLHSRHRALFDVLNSEKNPYLYSAFYQHIFRNVYDYITVHRKRMTPKYPQRQVAALICNGLCGVISECFAGEEEPSRVRGDIISMFNDILRSGIFDIRGGA